MPASIGILVFGWAQGYYNMLLSDAFSKHDFKLNIILTFLIMCLCGTGVLWFNHVLWINSLILKLIIKFEKNKLLQFFSNVNLIKLLFFGIGLLLSAKILNGPIVVYRFGIYGYAYLLGYFVFSHENNLKHLESNYIFLVCVSVYMYVTLFYNIFNVSILKPLSLYVM